MLYNMKGIRNNAIRLKRYFGLIGDYKEIPKFKLLSSNEALKSFGGAWNENSGGNVMMMLSVAEHEYMAANSYNENEMNAVKYALSRVAKFMGDCGKEWEEYENRQAKKAEK